MHAAYHHLLTLSAAASLFVIAPQQTQASTTQIIYSFAGGADGEYADTDLVRDESGNLYGTTVQGGAHASGTVWQLHPNGDGTWTHTVLYSFTGGADGGEPYKGVTLDANGNLYVTAVTGGSGGCEGGCGVTYALTKNGATWSQAVIHSFNGIDGSGPGAGVTIDDAGNVFGTTPTGGANGLGNVYELSPGKHGKWKFTEVHAFTGSDGIGGSAGRMILRGRTFYDANTAGGLYGDGNIFALTRQHGEWNYTVLYDFTGDPDVGFPYGGLTFDAMNNIYGTTYYDGAHDQGGVYQLTSKHGTWSERLLYSFKGGTDGAGSIGNLVLDTSGALYGTTSEGGSAGLGTVFRLTPGAHHKWTESVMYSFAGTPDGSFAYNGMVGDGAGHYFGTTTQGGAADDGAIYEFTP